jgi:hypothetical protein
MSTRIWFTDESGRMCWFVREDIEQIWTKDNYPSGLYLLTGGIWLVGPSSLYESESVWQRLTSAEAVEWCVLTGLPEPPQLAGLVQKMHISAPSPLSQAPAWPLQPRCEGGDILDGCTFMVERTLYRQADGIWVLHERYIHQQAEMESRLDIITLTPTQAATLLVENGYSLPDELLPYFQASALPPAEVNANTSFVGRKPDDPELAEAEIAGRAAVLITHTDKPSTEIAQQVQRPRSWFYKNPITRAAIAGRRGTCDDLPSGEKTAEGELEAWGA